MFQEHTRCDVVITPSMKLSPEIYIDRASNLAITAVSTTAEEGSIAMVFSPATGRFITSCRLNVDVRRTDKIICGVHGIYMERDASLFRRLAVYPDGRPANIPMDAEDYLFRSRSRQSIETWRSESGGGPTTVSRHGTDATSASSFGGHTAKIKERNVQNTWGRGFMGAPTDESWMHKKVRKPTRVLAIDGNDSD